MSVCSLNNVIYALLDAVAVYRDFTTNKTYEYGLFSELSLKWLFAFFLN